MLKFKAHVFGTRFTIELRKYPWVENWRSVKKTSSCTQQFSRERQSGRICHYLLSRVTPEVKVQKLWGVVVPAAAFSS